MSPCHYSLCQMNLFPSKEFIIIIIIIMCVLPKDKSRNYGCSSAEGMSSTANSGTKVAVLPKGRSSTANSGPQGCISAQRQVFHRNFRNQGCSSFQKAGFSLQTQEPRLQFFPKAGFSLQTQEPRLQFCPKAGVPLQTQEPRLQFCTKAGLPLQTQEPRLQIYQGRIGAVASRFFPHPTLSSASEQTLKDLQDPRGTNEEVRRVNMANWALRTSPNFATGVKYQFHQGFLTRSEIWKSQSPFARMSR